MKSLNFFYSELILVVIFQLSSAVPSLLVSNSGPSVLDSNITFSAVLLHYEPRHQLTFVFEDGIRHSERAAGRSLNVSASFPFPSDVYEGDRAYEMSVTVYSDNYFFKETVVSNTSRFELKTYLLGRMLVSQDGRADVDQVAVGENVSVSVALTGDDRFLAGAAVDYSWSVDFEKSRTQGNTLLYTFTDAGPKDVKGAVTALFPNNDFKYGFFERTIQAKVPVHGINVTGNPFLYHGDTLSLNVTCNGTPPFVYCYEILRGNASSASNWTCGHRSTFTNCKMEIVKYIQEDGTYQVAIYISNNVREVTRVIEVMVYSVPVRPTLSLVIVPVVCGLLTLVIIAAGIGHCVRQRGRAAVEVADFDFVEDAAAAYSERTFFENLLSCFRPPSPSEEEPLMD